MLALISPIPALDAVFELANKTIAGLLILIYVFSPWAAFVLNLIIFLVCLILFNWTNRRIKYLKAILLEPMILALKRKLFNKRDDVLFLKEKERLVQYVPELELSVKCFPNRALGKIKKKDLCYLVFSDEVISLIKPRFLRSPVITERGYPLDASGSCI